MSTLTEAAAACCACIRVRWVTTPGPDGTVSGRWVCSTCEREFEPRDLSAIRSVAAELQCEPTREAVLEAIARGDLRIAHLERTLSRVQDERESSRAALASVGEERNALRADYEGACKTIAEMHGAAVGGFGQAPRRGVVEDVTELRADWNKQAGRANELADELAKFRANFARDQAELASMRITLAEAKADLEQAAKVTCELVDGLSEETRKRQVAEVEAERLKLLKAEGDSQCFDLAKEVERLKQTLTTVARRGQVGPPEKPGPGSSHWYALANELGALAASALDAHRPKCVACHAPLGEHHAALCHFEGQVLPSEIPGYVESIAAEVMGKK